MKKLHLTLLLAASLLSHASLAQEAFRNPSVTHLMQTYGLSQQEAQMRVDLQSEILALSERLNASGDAAYGDMFIQHEPVFRIVTLFADRTDRKAFLDSLDPKLRRYVQLKVAKKSRGVFTRELEALNAALTTVGVPFTSKYDLPSEQFVVTVETEAAAQRVRTSLPDTRKVETLVQVAPLPKIQAAPVGAAPGDRLFGGDALRNIPGQGGEADCTVGFGVSYTIAGVAKRGYLTSGHCANTMYANVNGREITLSSPDVERRERPADGLADKYDFQIFDATGLTVDNRVRFVDKNNIPEFPATGELRLTAITSFLNQKAGMVVCKSGANTGITCGEITNGNLTWDGVPGWIEVSRTRQSVISAGGDSGSPWFLYPGSSTTITGVGVHTAGNAVPGSTGIAIYMPIDYIDDQNSTINTIKQ